MFPCRNLENEATMSLALNYEYQENLNSTDFVLGTVLSTETKLARPKLGQNRLYRYSQNKLLIYIGVYKCTK